MNAIGSWASTTGLAEAARRSVGAASRVGVDVSIEDVPYWAPTDSNRFPSSLQSLPRGRTHDIEVCYFNVNEMDAVTDAFLHEEGSRRYVVGSWFWELGSLPMRYLPNLARVDEVWAPSRFVRDMFLQYGVKSVVTMPCVVEPEVDGNLSRADFGIPAGGCVFLFHFDANSTFARKNPLGVIEAFRRAFGRSARGSDVHLVMKVLNLHPLTEARQLLRSELASVGGILIETDMSAVEVASLVSLCDVYVSLHRAEGFGLGIAEAMFFGKPVVATAFSGPEDFLTPTNSCMVGYRPRTIGTGDIYLNPGMEVYEVGKTWAEPDLVQAARWMQGLAARPDDRRRIGHRATEAIHRKYNSLTAGSAIRSRLRQIESAEGL
jgi:glycosyltransferase involved in cell wall biosynthesis